MIIKNLPKIKNGFLNPIQLKKLNYNTSKTINNEKTTFSKMIIDCENLQTIKNEKEKIFDFLKDLNLEKYTELFIKNGINTEEKIFYLNFDNLKLLKIPYAHCKRLLRKINDIQKNDTKINKLKNNNKYEEIICPKEEDDIEQNEEEERRKFSEAILNFKKEINKTVNEEILKNKNSKPNILDNQNNINDKEDKIYKDESINTLSNKNITNKIDISKQNKDRSQFFPLNKPKTLCHQCLHMILHDHCIQKYNKLFCSLHCVDVFESKNITLCGNCKKKIEIVYSFPSIIKPKTFYCSYECLNIKEPNENNDINKSLIINSQVFKNINPSNNNNEPIVDILDL